MPDISSREEREKVSDFLARQRPMFSSREMENIENMVPLIAGAGGLGTHQAVELQRVGVRKMYIADYDRVETSNLNRQILYGSEDRGRSKALRAKLRLESFGLGTNITTLEHKIDSDFALPGEVNIVFDAMDNIEGRLALEACAAHSGVPLVHGAVSSWFGQLTTIIAGMTISLRDIYGEEALQPQQSSPPVFSPSVAIVASLQVIEGIKVLLEKSGTLLNRLLLIDLRDYTLDTIPLGSRNEKRGKEHGI